MATAAFAGDQLDETKAIDDGLAQETAGMNLRGKLTTDAGGRFWFR